MITSNIMGIPTLPAIAVRSSVGLELHTYAGGVAHNFDAMVTGT